MEEHGVIFLEGFQCSGIAGSTSPIPNVRKGSTAVIHVQGIGYGGVFSGIYLQDISWSDMAAAKCPQGSTRRKYRRVIWLRQSIHRNLLAGHILEGFAPIFSLRGITVNRKLPQHILSCFILFFLSEPYQYIQRDWHCHL